MNARLAYPAAECAARGRRRRRLPALPVATAALAVAGNVAFVPYYAVRADDPATLHVALGVRPAWAPPAAADAHLALQRRFPGRVPGDPTSLAEPELVRLYLVRRNTVRWVVHWTATLALASAVLACARRFHSRQS